MLGPDSEGLKRAVRAALLQQLAHHAPITVCRAITVGGSGGLLLSLVLLVGHGRTRDCSASMSVSYADSAPRTSFLYVSPEDRRRALHEKYYGEPC